MLACTDTSHSPQRPPRTRRLLSKGLAGGAGFFGGQPAVTRFVLSAIWLGIERRDCDLETKLLVPAQDAGQSKLHAVSQAEAGKLGPLSTFRAGVSGIACWDCMARLTATLLRSGSSTRNGGCR